jgi:hypothetical protein
MHKIYSPSNGIGMFRTGPKNTLRKLAANIFYIYIYSLQITDELRMYQAHDEKTYAKFEGKLQGERKLCGQSQKGLPVITKVVHQAGWYC